MNAPIDCLAQADLLLLLSDMLDAPRSWSAEDWAVGSVEIEELASRTGLDRQPEGVGLLRNAISAWHAIDPELARIEYARLFEGNAPCTPNETIFVRRDKGAVLADIAGFYRAFGFDLAPVFREKHDHLVAELQFAALLLVLMGRAADAGSEDQRVIASKALRGFLTDHLGVWVGAFAERMESLSVLPCYVATARLAAAVWEMLKDRHGLAQLHTTTPLPMADRGSPYECGACTITEPDTAL